MSRPDRVNATVGKRWQRGPAESPRYKRIAIRYDTMCVMCGKGLRFGEELMWDTRYPGDVYCDVCAEELQIATPRVKTLFD